MAVDAVREKALADYNKSWGGGARRVDPEGYCGGDPVEGAGEGGGP